MTRNAGGAVMDEDEVIEVLRAVGRDGGPPLRDGPERVLAVGRQVRRRRRALGAAASGVALAGVAALSFVMAQAGPTGRPIVLFPASAGSGQGEPQVPSEQAEANQQVLQAALGDDFVISETEGFPPGFVTVRPGSPAAEGLPAGYELGAALSAGKGDAAELARFCAPMVEKGLVVDACTTRILPDGEIVYEQRAHSQPGAYAPPANPGASDGVRVLFARPDGTLVVVDLWAWDHKSNSTPQRRAEVRAWIDAMSPRLANAATDPSVQAVDR